MNATGTDVSFFTENPSNSYLESGDNFTFTTALSLRMGKGEASTVGRRIQPLWKLRETGLTAPSPVGGERVRARDVLLDVHLHTFACFCTDFEANEGTLAGGNSGRSEEHTSEL